MAEKAYGGGTPTTSIGDFWGGTIPWIQSSDVKDGTVFGVVPRKYITQKGLKNSASQLAPQLAAKLVEDDIVEVFKKLVIPVLIGIAQCRLANSAGSYMLELANARK